MFKHFQGVKVKDNVIKIALDFFVPGYPHAKDVSVEMQHDELSFFFLMWGLGRSGCC